MKPLSTILALAFLMALSDCAASPALVTSGASASATPTPPGRTFLALTWTSPWTSGMQSGPMTFPGVGETATLSIAESLVGSPYGQPYTVSVDEPCVTIDSKNTDVSTQVASAGEGTCTITVTDSYGNVVELSATVR